METLLADRHVQEEINRIWQSLSDEEQRALSFLVHGGHSQTLDGVLAQLQQKGLVGGKWAESNQIFSPLLEKYIYKERPFVVARVRIDRHKHIVWVDDHAIENIPVLEFKFLEYLDRRRGQVCRRDQIARYLYPDQKLAGVSTNAIDSIVKRLRKLLELNPKKPVFIITVHGVGFRLVDGESVNTFEKPEQRQ
jgi:DNA-binding winged helix-turn-helix (wHTH) protein